MSLRHARSARRQPLFALGLALNVALVWLLLSALSASPASATTLPGQVFNSVTETAWLPLQCTVNGDMTSGITAHGAVALRATLPASVNPGQKFSLHNVVVYEVVSANAQASANSVFNADTLGGTMSDLESNLANATAGFQAPDNGTQVNIVRALQPPNPDGPSPVDPFIDPDANNPAPGPWWAAQIPPVVASDAQRQHVFSFGPYSIDTSFGHGFRTAPTIYAPVPGTGAGTNTDLSMDGTPAPINPSPFTVTGAVGQSVVIAVGDASRTVRTVDGSGPLVAISQGFIRDMYTGNWDPNTYTISLLSFCGVDNTPKAVPKPDPTMVDNFTIPIVAAPGLLRVAQPQLSAVPTQVGVDSQIADDWSLSWLKETAGPHTVCFAHVQGWTEPPCQNVTVSNGATTTVTGNFTQRGSLRVLNSPGVASAISVDGNPSDEYGMWTDIPTGAHPVCWGKVIGWDPPACQNVNVNAGATTTVTGTFTSNSSALGQTGVGWLRAVTSPALPSQVSIQQGGTKWIADSWGLSWLELSPGSYTVSFSHVSGWTEPAPQPITVTAGNTTSVTGTFIQRGELHVLTSPAVAATIFVDDMPRDDWGMFTDIPTGSHTVCFGPAPGYATAPPCQAANVNVANETDITGTYQSSP